jgi:cellulose synthase/poly-beta-1,6-N-acetylglucosamine synthase-like glycosyltransferase
VLGLIGFFLYCAAMLIALPTTIFALECVMALLPSRRSNEGEGGTGSDQPSPDATATAGKARARYAVIVPAHDEAAVIAETLTRLTSEVDASGRVFVIADNCSDATAQIASRYPVTVLERFDAHHRGKGFALAFAARHLENDPPEILVFVDADCLVSKGAIGALVDASAASGHPAQADYVLVQHDSSPRSALSAFAFMVRNRVRPLGLARMGGPTGLFGTGMAIPFALFASLPNAEDHLVEDMWLGVECALRGKAARFVPDAKVESAAANADDVTRKQRTRWEHGHLAVIRDHVPRLLTSGKTEAILLGIDLAIPPLALLTLMHVALFLLAVVYGIASARWDTCVLVFSSGIWLAGAVGLAWMRFGRSMVSARTLLAIPGYVLWKIPVYLGFARKRETEWVRTSRAESKREP